MIKNKLRILKPKSIKGFFSIAISLVLVASVSVTIAGCGGSSSGAFDEGADGINATGFPISQKPIEMTMFAPSTGSGTEWDVLPALTYYAEKTNINFKYTTPNLTDVSTKLNLALSTGEYQDVLFGLGSDSLSPQVQAKYGAQGVLLPLETMIDKWAPNLKKALEAHPEVKKSITAPDGHIYSLPYIETGSTGIWPRGPLWYNGDWLKKLNISDDQLPTTLDDFKALLTKMKNTNLDGKGNDQIPLIDTDGNSIRPWLMSAFGLLSNDVQQTNDKVFYTPIDERYKNYVTFMHELYDQGLLDREIYQQQDEQKKAKGAANRVGVFPDWFPYFTTGQAEDDSMGNYMWHPLSSSDSPEAVVPISQSFSTGAFAITKHCKSPAAALRWVDYTYSKEGNLLFTMGPEGKFYKTDKREDGSQVYVYVNSNDPDSEKTRAGIAPCFGIVCPGLSFPEDNRVYKESNKEEKGEQGFGKWITEQTEAKVKKYGVVPFPSVILSSEEADKVSTIKTELDTYLEEWEAKFITGKASISDKWDEFVSTIKGMGVDDYVKVYQDAYDRWKKS